jgi:glycosyltransferase involved in cell wall biosynthesis
LANVRDNCRMTNQFASFQVIGSRPSGGAERFYSRLCNALTAMGHPTLAINQAGSSVATELDPGVACEHVRMRGVWDRLARWQLGAMTRRYAPPVVQTYMGRATRIYRKPRNGSTVHIARLGGYYDVAGYRHADAWIGNTQGICDYLVKEGLPGNRVFHLGNFVEPAKPLDDKARADARVRFGLGQDDFVVLLVGRLHANKGIPDLLKAMAALPERVADRRVRLLLVGDGGQRDELERLVAELDIAERVVMTGWVADPDPCYALADLFVCASVHEPLGNVVLEAWSHGLPVVSTRSQGPVEFMHDGQDGWMIPIGDPPAMAKAIERALGEPDDVRAAMGRAGLAQVMKHHSRDGVAGAFHELYEQLTR